MADTTTSVSVQHARENLADLLSQVRWADQCIEITRYNKPAAYLVSPEWFERAQKALSGSAE